MVQTNQIVPKALHTFKVFSTTLRPGHEIRVRFPGKWLVILLFSLTLSLNIPPPLQGDNRTASSKTTCYVTPKGKDRNTGTLNAPWKSPGFASRKLKTGDTLIIFSGSYILSRYDENILSPTSDTTNAWMTIRCKEGAQPVWVGRDALTMSVDLSGARYVRIENLEIIPDDQ